MTFLLWSCVLTFPLVLQPATHLPQGSESVGTVPLFNLWTIQWNIEQLQSGFSAYWNAPIFAPTPGTFAFSEIQPVSALLAAPIWLATGSPGLAYNALVLLFLTLNGWFAFWLLRDWQLEPLAALPGGLLVQSIPFVAQEMGVLQLMALFGFLWSLLFLYRLLRFQTHRRSNSFGLVLGLPLTFLTCSYYGSFSLLFLPLAALIFWDWRRQTLKRLLQVIVLGLVSLGLVMPVILTQNAILKAHNMTRSPETIQNNAAQPADYLKWLDTNLFYSRILRLDSSPGQRLFPGLGLIGLGTWGLLSRSGSGTGHRRRKIYLGAAALLAFCLSLGPNLHLGEWQPYWLLGDIIPGFEQLRSPFRFAAFFQLHLALLAGLGLARFVSFAADSALPARQKWADLLVSLIVGLTIFELLALPLPLKQVPNLSTTTDWQRWLRRQEAPRVIFLPFAPSPRVADFEPTVEWMLGQPHWRGELINGYSGFFPPDHGDLRTALTAFPNAAGLRVLQAKAVDYVVVDYRRPGAPSRETMETALPLAYYDEAAKVGIYRLTAAR